MEKSQWKNEIDYILSTGKQIIQNIIELIKFTKKVLTEMGRVTVCINCMPTSINKRRDHRKYKD